LVRLDGRGKAGALEVHRAIGGLDANEGFVTREINDLPRVEFFAESAVQVLDIGEADAEGDERADNAEDTRRAPTCDGEGRPTFADCHLR
jgi:hypothetical protein